MVADTVQGLTLTPATSSHRESKETPEDDDP